MCTTVSVLVILICLAVVSQFVMSGFVTMVNSCGLEQFGDSFIVTISNIIIIIQYYYFRNNSNDRLKVLL